VNPDPIVATAKVAAAAVAASPVVKAAGRTSPGRVGMRPAIVASGPIAASVAVTPVIPVRVVRAAKAVAVPVVVVAAVAEACILGRVVAPADREASASGR
jgi:hypothetical protein